MNNLGISEIFLQPQYFDVDGNRIAVYQRRSDTRIVTVFLHGYLTNASTWSEVLSHFDPDASVVLVDLPGHGNSRPVKKGCWNLDYIVDVLDQLMQLLGLSHFHLIGSQMGGSIASYYAIKYPDKIEALCIMAAGALGETKSNMVFFRLLENSFTGGLIRRFMTYESFQQKWLAAHGSSYQVRESRVRYFFKHFQKMATAMSTVALGIRESYGESFDTLAGPLSDLNVRTLLIWGSDDQVVPLAIGERYNKLITNSRLIVLDGVGDFPQEESPLLVAIHLYDFLLADKALIGEASNG